MYRRSIIILGNGYIGNNLYNYLSYNKPDDLYVTVCCRQALDYHNIDVFRRYINDISDQTSDQVVVINCAGFTGKPNVDECEKNTVRPVCWDFNANLPLKLGIACKETGVHYLHISSGCIYNGYDKLYTEEDEPNFGISAPNSSFYSKSKHAGELNLKSINFGKILRIRMPFCDDLSNQRNLIHKISKFTRLMSSENSLTCVEDLCEFIRRYVNEVLNDYSFEIFNVVNQGITTARIIASMLGDTERWIFCTEDELQLTAKRSNTVLSTEKIKSLGLQLPEVNESLLKCIRLFKKH